MVPASLIQSPLNYTGGKYKLLPQLLPLFPARIETFVDLFCGGCSVGINVEAKRHLYNDTNRPLSGLYRAFQNSGKEAALETIYRIIETYGLSLSSRNGYAYYGCESGGGLGAYNKEKFLKMREDFNARTDRGADYYLLFYVILAYSFNNQIRFNRAGKFNLPVGKRDFNRNMERKLLAFMDALQAQDARFSCLDFRDFDVSGLTERDFVYLDPPYLITCATYNEQDGWNPEKEKQLLAFIETLSAAKIKCALSNVLASKGKENTLLTQWLAAHTDRYSVHPLACSYANSNYHTKDKSDSTREVLITNYG